MNRYESAVAEAEKALEKALQISELSWAECEAQYRRSRLQQGEMAAKTKSLELSSWQLTHEGRTTPDPKAAAANSFLLAGKYFTVAFESSLSSFNSKLEELEDKAVQAFKNALIALHTAFDVARWSQGEICRRYEITAAHSIAYAHLTAGEVFDSIMNQHYSTKGGTDALLFGLAAQEAIGGGISANDCRSSAAQYYELEGHLAAKYDQLSDAADAYSTAAYQYANTGNYVVAARNAAMEFEIRSRISDRKGASNALQLKVDYLLRALQGAKESNEKSDLGWAAVAAYFAVGQLMVEDETQKSNGANLIFQGGELAFKLPANNSAIIDEDGSLIDANSLVLSSLRKAEEVYEDTGQFKRADSTHYLRRRYARKYASALLSFVSLLLELTWGYGTKPLRLLITSFVVLFGFAVAYAVLTAIAETGLSALFQSSTLGPIALEAAILSVRSFALDLLIKWHDLFGFKAELPSAPAVRYLVWIEAAAGLALIAMSSFSLGRWFKRNFIPH